MKPTIDGGPAFPSSCPTYDDGGVFVRDEPIEGMTLRDYFAGQAIHTAFSDLLNSEHQGVGIDVDGLSLKPGEDVYTAAEYIAKQAYTIADAMITEGAKTK